MVSINTVNGSLLLYSWFYLQRPITLDHWKTICWQKPSIRQFPRLFKAPYFPSGAPNCVWGCAGAQLPLPCWLCREHRHLVFEAGHCREERSRGVGTALGLPHVPHCNPKPHECCHCTGFSSAVRDLCLIKQKTHETKWQGIYFITVIWPKESKGSAGSLNALSCYDRQAHHTVSLQIHQAAFQYQSGVFLFTWVFSCEKCLVFSGAAIAGKLFLTCVSECSS